MLPPIIVLNTMEYAFNKWLSLTVIPSTLELKVPPQANPGLGLLTSHSVLGRVDVREGELLGLWVVQLDQEKVYAHAHHSADVGADEGHPPPGDAVEGAGPGERRRELGRVRRRGGRRGWWGGLVRVLETWWWRAGVGDGVRRGARRWWIELSKYRYMAG